MRISFVHAKKLRELRTTFSVLKAIFSVIVKVQLVKLFEAGLEANVLNKKIVIEMRSIEKHFGLNAALKKIHLEIEHGELVCITGGNGAGKTALLEVMTGLQLADAGYVQVMGHELLSHYDELKEEIGMPMPSTNLVESLSVYKAMELFQSFYKRKYDLNELIEIVGLEHYRDKVIKRLSGGFRQRMMLALALVHNPSIIVLDEPTIGLEMQMKDEYWQLLHKLQHMGKTIVISSHDMAQAQQYCSRIAIMRKGEIAAYEQPQRLISELPGGGLTLEAVYMHHY